MIVTDHYRSERYDLVIVCNGGKSKLRNLITCFKYEKEYNWGALWGVFENTGIATDVLYQRYHGTKKLLGFLPCGIDPVSGKQSVSFFWSLSKTHHQQFIDRGIDAFKEELLQFDPAVRNIYNCIKSFNDFSFVTYTNVYAKEWKQGNVFFIGDCVHGMSPQLGLGANMALYDGLLIGKILKANNGAVSSLASLRQIRSDQNLYYHLTSRLLTKFFQSDYNSLGVVRDIIFPYLPKIKFVDKLMVETLCGSKNGFLKNLDLNSFLRDFK